MSNREAGALRRLAPLFVVQFACWSGMFLMWIGAYPVIITAILHASVGDPQALRRGMLVVAGCFCWYASLSACLSFAIPGLTRRLDPPALLAISTAIGAIGLAGLGVIERPPMLILCFTALAIGWCGLSNLSYTIAIQLLGEDAMEHGLRVFAFSSILPQVVVTLAVVLAIGEITPTTARAIMLAAGGAMATGSALTLLLRRRLRAAR